MKIGYVTIHYGNNFGTVLQTYALYEVIKKKFNCEIELIYYFPYHFLERKESKIPITSIKSLFLRYLLPICNKQISENYARFISKNINVTKKYTKDELKHSKLNYDMLLVGSDQVWNTDYNNGIDDIYYLNFSKNINKRVSYASSFGKSNFDKTEVDEIKRNLLEFDYISVREFDAKKNLQLWGFDDVQHVLDPTFLLTGKEWGKFIKKNIKENYILIYALDENMDIIIDKAKEISKKKNLKIYMISNNLTRNNRVDKLFCYNKVPDFLTLIANADFIITNSFHGTAFSITLNRQFLTLVKTKYNSRINSILKLVNLEDRMVPIDLLLKNKTYEELINFKKCNEILENERKKSMNYLKEAIMTSEDL